MLGVFIPDRFQTRYQRNNKRGGLKNLRCFPECGLQHKERGFCGRPVIARIHHSEEVIKPICWARFIPLDTPLSFRVGQVIFGTSMDNQERSKKNPLLPWIRGKLLSAMDTSPFIEEAKIASVKPTSSATAQGLAQHFDVAFNSELNGWHYGYASNKHSCNSMHCFEVAVFDKCSPREQIECKVIFRSTPFQLFCRRRRRFTIQPTAPTALDEHTNKDIGDRNLNYSDSTETRINELNGSKRNVEEEPQDNKSLLKKELPNRNVGDQKQNRKSAKQRSKKLSNGKAPTVKSEVKKRKAGKVYGSNRRRSASVNVNLIPSNNNVADNTSAELLKEVPTKTTTAEAIDLLLGLRKPA